MARDRCVDCLAEAIVTKRPLAPLAPGPRCATHWRQEKKRRALRAAERRVLAIYEMPPQIYDRILASQGGRCAICQIANGTAKRLAVEHKHNQPGCEHPPDHGCPKCWRGICCGRCNELLARFTPEQLGRAIAYLADPPAQRTIGRWVDYDDGHAGGHPHWCKA